MTFVVNALKKTIGQTIVLDSVSFTLPLGQIVGLVGPNGVGKTTIFKTIKQQYLADAGMITLDGHQLETDPTIQTQLFYLDSRQLFFDNYTLAKISQTMTWLYPTFDPAHFDQLLARFELAKTQSFHALSKGNRALVLIGLALASHAPYVFLDEPFDGLDILIRAKILRLLVDAAADGDRTFLIASHDLAELDGLSDRVLFLNDGRISQDLTLEAVRQKAVKLQLVFKTAAVPEVVKQYGRIVAVRGRVLEAVFPDFSPTVQALLAATEPVLNDPLPLSLADLFRAEYRPQPKEASAQ